jgi:hypothetical protein
MHNRISKIGNQYSSLMDQFVTAAEQVKSKTATTFKDSLIKIAATKQTTLHETLTKLANTVKKAQLNMPPDEPTPNMGMPNPDQQNPGLGDDFNDDGLNAEPNSTANVEEAKTDLAKALIALCGTVENAVQCLQSQADLESPESETTEGEDDWANGLGEDMGDDMVPPELLSGQQPKPFAM